MRRWCLLVTLCLVAVVFAGGGPPCDHYGGRGCRPFLPAPPGKRPSCASPGATFCEKPEHYPTHLIQYLIERWGYDYSSLLTDESRMEFKTPRPPAPYPSYHHHHSPPSAVPTYYYPPPAPHHYDASHHTTAPFNASTTFAGYPDRRYKLDPPHLVGPLVYTAVVPAPYTPSGDWWTRFSRSVDVQPKSGEGEEEKKSSRPKRQSASANTQKLCPTNAQFIMPKAAMNNRGNWMYVVNLNEVSDRYTQLVRSETCVSSTCSGLCSLPNGYTSSCEQQYVQKRLVALDGSGDRLYTDVFWFPHCCVCQITQTG
ncbi:protein spaetzle 5 [Ischnura elegans]|uniref:protein spaetzle 5 n=1 Tax=Ischnura elegans TaxID=197161 RepID=UPI001ED8B333|nr:protein spaetzle 5 [Ischnura elegans]